MIYRHFSLGGVQPPISSRVKESGIIVDRIKEDILSFRYFITIDTDILY